MNYHIIVVDNCSTDDSLTAINNELKDTKMLISLLVKKTKATVLETILELSMLWHIIKLMSSEF